MQTDSNRKDAETNYAAPRSMASTPRVVNRLAVNKLAAEQAGNNVNDKVLASNTKVSNNSFDPNLSGYSNLSSDFTVDGKVNEGDYFTVTIPENVTVNGDVNYEALNNIMNVKSLKDSEGNIVANGKYDVNNKVVTYTFTDYVKERENIKGNIQLPIFTDRKNTPNSGYYNNTFDVAGEKYETNFDIQYGSPVQGLTDVNGPNISSFITDIDKHSEIILINKQSMLTQEKILFIILQ